MNNDSTPLVSVVTPVYNDERDLEDCIQSVISQTYPNWEYVIVNNCSTDRSGDIAARYAADDPRIRVVNGTQFLPAVANHNFALRQISPESKYCKVVFAVDMIFPDCLEKMVAVAQEYPSAGIVGAYALQGKRVLGAPSPFPEKCIPGKVACRQYFLDRKYVFGTATAVLYRADLVRSHDPFFNESNIHADFEVCVDLLRNCDFGFVSQVLSFTRERERSLTSHSSRLETYIAGRLHDLVQYGSAYLSPDEFINCKKRLLAEYYNLLAVNLLRGRRDQAFWQFHREKLNEEGFPVSRWRLAVAVAKRTLRALIPMETIDKFSRVSKFAE
jgi:glycosyltransferase involved in cell wall biosynthesis